MMPPAQNVTTLDLHGRRLEQAIAELTTFLDRIRRTVAAASRRPGGPTRAALFVHVVTGAGAHSPHGPVLRAAVRRLLTKRGMTFALERGGGAFRVDALSGWDLHAAGPATESKVLVAEGDAFRRLAAARRGRHPGLARGERRHAARRGRSVAASSAPRPPRRSDVEMLGAAGDSRLVDLRAGYL